jgi:hypothetical protein
VKLPHCHFNLCAVAGAPQDKNAWQMGKVARR